MASKATLFSTSIPTSPTGGETYYDVTTNQLRIFVGSSWAIVSDNSHWGKPTEEENLDALCEQHPGLKELREKFEAYKALVTTSEEQ